ncbi:Ig-like domain-containing protein, partial [Aeromonas veronii]|uniref:Ig-like domain-containing protein n=1 Tax=Aeromonas veronii TaxID=654 RepID=UPI003D1A65EF
TVKADVTDKAGNPASDKEEAILDSDNADLPEIDLAAIGDGNLSVDEAKAVELKGETRHVEDGQKVTLTVTDVNNKSVTFEATVSGGKFSTIVNLAASGLADGKFTVKADVTDKAGNPASDKEEAILDSDNADLPGIDLAAIGDGNLSVDEAKAVELKGTTRNVEDGQKVTLTVTDVNNKSVTFEATVSGGKFSTTVDLSGKGLVDGQFTVKADVTDQAGNPATDSEKANLDGDDADLPSINLAAIGDGDLSVAEAKAVVLEGTTSNVEDGQKVTLTVTDAKGNTVSFEATVNDGKFSTTVDLSGKGLVDGQFTVKADVTDKAGNPATDSEKANLDGVAAPAPTVELQGAGSDDVYNKAEIGSDNSVTAKVTLTAGTQVGDLLVVKDGAGNVLLSRPVTATDLSSGVNVEVPVSGNPSSVKVTAQVTDIAGNPSEIAEDTAKVDNVAAPAPTVELQGAGSDDTYNKAEIGSDNSVTAKVTLADGTQVGDLLVVKDGAGNVLLSRPVTATDLSSGVNVEVPVSGNPSSVKVTAQVTDIAGNPSEIAEDTAKVDNVAAPAPTVELQGAGSDDTYNKAEIGSDNSVTAKVTLSAGTQVGDLLVVKDGAGNVLLSRPVTATDLSSGVNVEVP